MPDQNGFYWVNTDINDDVGENWRMAYLDCEGVREDEITLTTFCPEIARACGIKNPCTVWSYSPSGEYHKWLERTDDFTGSWSGPEVWVGPINIPGGPFGGPICEPQVDDWLKATEDGDYVEVIAQFHRNRKVVESVVRTRTVKSTTKSPDL